MDIKTQDMSFEEIQRTIWKLRIEGDLDRAVELCTEASENNRENYFFPKITGDLYAQKEAFDLASDYYISFLTKIRKNHKLFNDFAKRYHWLRRIWPQEKISEFAYRLSDEFQKGNISTYIWDWCRELIKDDLDQEITISEAGKEFCNLIITNSSFKKFVNHVKRMEKDNYVELRYLLDEKILKRNRDISYFRIDAYCLSIYERLGENQNALKIASEILSVKMEAVIVRSIFRICRKIKDYAIAEKIMAKYPEILKKSEFNIQYELVYYSEAQNQIEDVYNTLRRMEKSKPILKQKKGTFRQTLPN